MTDVLIAGGGIGGLTAALTLHARGIESTVLERASHLRPLGVGINLLPHAVRELYDLGVGDELANGAVAPTSISYCDTEGTLLFREPRGIDGGYGYPQYSVHRGALQMLLLSTLRERLGPDAVRTDTEVRSFDAIRNRRAGAHLGRRLHGWCAGRRRWHPFGGAGATSSRTRPADVVRCADVQGRGAR